MKVILMTTEVEVGLTLRDFKSYMNKGLTSVRKGMLVLFKLTELQIKKLDTKTILKFFNQSLKLKLNPKNSSSFNQLLCILCNYQSNCI